MIEKPAWFTIPNKKFTEHSKNYKGFPMKQADNAVDVFTEFFKIEKFDRVIELGTGSGGFTLFLGEHYGKKLYTFDIRDKLIKVEGIKKQLKKLGVSINVVNIFETNDVKKLIIKKGRVLLLCDNGHKPREVELFSPILKSGDVIMVHDYFRTIRAYHEQNDWRCCAFIDKYIKDPRLLPFHQDLLEKAYWMCRIKK